MKIRCAVDAYDRTTTSYVVAYLDILGATNRIKDSTGQNDSLNLIHNLYKHIMDLANPDTGIKKYEGIQFKIFSDNIIIAKELTSGADVDSVLILLNCVSNFLCSSVGDSVGWLVRGGITIGDLYIDETIVWGSALVRAYELEDKIAVYPRVIIDNSIAEVLQKARDAQDYIRKDIDGLLYLNYMSIWHFSAPIVKNAFENMKAEARRADGTFPDKIYQKLHWHMEYINQELDRKNERQHKKYRLSL